MASQQELRKHYVGKDIADVPKPAIVLDAAIIRRHCKTMLHTVKALNVPFRAHVKTHKVRLASIPAGYQLLRSKDHRDCGMASCGQDHRRKLHRIDTARN